MSQTEKPDRFYAVICDSPRNTGKTLARISAPHAEKSFWTESDVTRIWKMDRDTAEDIVARLRFNTPQLVRYEKAVAIIEMQSLELNPEAPDGGPAL